MRGKFICFMGIDGSGKTTLVRETIKRFQAQGVEFRYVWGAYELTLLRPLVVWGKKILLRKRPPETYQDYLASLHTVGKSRLLSVGYQAAVLLEYLGQILFKVWLPLMRGQNIISDRYIFDTLISAKVNLNLTEAAMFRTMRVLLRFLPAPDRLVFIDVPEEVAYARKTDTPSLDYLRVRMPLYQKVAAAHRATVVDGTKPVEEIVTGWEWQGSNGTGPSRIPCLRITSPGLARDLRNDGRA
jgi:thymidylate kinase